jgi:hypothetical protein
MKILNRIQLIFSAVCALNRSHRICRLSQKSADTPKNLAKRKAVLGGYAVFLIYKLVDALIWNMNCVCQIALAYVHWNKKLISKHFAGMSGRSVGWNENHNMLLMVINPFDPSFRHGLPESRLQGCIKLAIPGTGYPLPAGMTAFLYNDERKLHPV